MAKNLVPDLLDELKSSETFTRNDAIKKIIKDKINDEHIIAALKGVIENDPSMSVRNFARSALDVFGVEHSAVEESTGMNSLNSEGNRITNEAIDNSANWPLIGLLVGLIPSFLFSLGFGFGLGLYLGFGGLLCGMLGAYIGKRDTGSTIGGAILGTLLGSFLWNILGLGGGIY